MDPKLARQKKKKLLSLLRRHESLLVAFSGGVDSAFLLAAAREALGDRAVAATGNSVIHPSRELKEAEALARSLGVEHIVISTGEMRLPAFAANPADRCYHCKKHVLEGLYALAREKGLKQVAHGANVDDLKDYRPGFKAAEEAGVLSPLVDAGLTKEEIRFLSREMGLPTWDKAPMPCLASRIPYGNPITEEKLRMIDEAENFLRDQGVDRVRVRHHGAVARIEAPPEDLKRFLEEPFRRAVVEKMRGLGFGHVALDLEGYQMGSLNRTIREKEKG